VAGDREAGAATCGITPPTGYPMWRYSSRRDLPTQGSLDPLRARALVAAEVSVGEGMIDRALINLDQMRGKLPELPPKPR